MDLRQIMLQMISGRMQANPMLQQVMQLKQQGMNAQQAMQQLSQQYPQLRQYAGTDPAQLDQMAQNTFRSVGIDPGQALNSLKKMF